MEKRNMQELRDKFKIRLKLLMEAKKIKNIDLARATGINRSFITSYLKGINIPRNDKLSLIAKALSTNEAYLLGLIDDDSPNPSHANLEEQPTHFIATLVDHYAPVRIEANLSSGMPDEVILTDEICYIPKKYEQRIKKRLVRAFRVNGNSMSNVIQHGDIAIIEKTENVIKNGDILAVLLEDGYEVTLKRFFKLEDKIILRPDSKDTNVFFDIILPLDANIQILGKLVYHVVNDDVVYN